MNDYVDGQSPASVCVHVVVMACRVLVMKDPAGVAGPAVDFKLPMAIPYRRDWRQISDCDWDFFPEVVRCARLNSGACMGIC